MTLIFANLTSQDVIFIVGLISISLIIHHVEFIDHLYFSFSVNNLLIFFVHLYVFLFLLIYMSFL